MTLGQNIQEILGLQQYWSAENTPAMQRRGDLVRNALPGYIQEYSGLLAPELGIHAGHYAVQGKDGEGNRSRVPWVRLFSSAHSPKPTEGWYVVFLFHTQGEAVYLCLGHGSYSRGADGDVFPRLTAEVETLVGWARGVLGKAPAKAGMVHQVDLGPKPGTGAHYPKSTVAAFRYDFNSIPNDDQIIGDLKVSLSLLARLYDAQDQGREPDSEPPEFSETVQAIRVSLGGTRRGGQGTGLTPSERRAVELRAMDVVSDHLRNDGYSVEDTSKNKSYDFLATKGQEAIVVEVKGTTASLGSVIVTAAERRAQREAFPGNALMIVHSIELTERGEQPIAEGGVLEIYWPWDVDKGDWDPIGYRHLPCNT